jgi:tRNA A37 methylthiotransferase MiaB
MPEVDNFLGSADMLGLAQVLSGGAERMGVSPLSRRAYLYDHTTPRQVSGRIHSAYLKIAEGCDRPCAFCIIPKLRGPQRSRTIESIAAEAEMLVSGGARELCLVAQDLTTYGTDLGDKPDLERCSTGCARCRACGGSACTTRSRPRSRTGSSRRSPASRRSPRTSTCRCSTSTPTS